MDIYVGNLPADTTQAELEKFFKGFHKKADIRLIRQQFENDESCCYGLVSIDAERLALKAIKKLNGKRLRSRELLLREFHHRSYNNERRSPGWRNGLLQDNERRSRDRRRAVHRPGVDDDFERLLNTTPQQVQEEEEVIDEKNLKVTAYRDLSRKL